MQIVQHVVFVSDKINEIKISAIRNFAQLLTK
jgi:hypothetical protein